MVIDAHVKEIIDLLFDSVLPKVFDVVKVLIKPSSLEPSVESDQEDGNCCLWCATKFPLVVRCSGITEQDVDRILMKFEGKPETMLEIISALLRDPAVQAAALNETDPDLQDLLKQAASSAAGWASLRKPLRGSPAGVDLSALRLEVQDFEVQAKVQAAVIKSAKGKPAAAGLALRGRRPGWTRVFQSLMGKLGIVFNICCAVVRPRKSCST